MIYRIVYYNHSTGLTVTEEFKDRNEAISHYNYNLRFGRVWWYEIEEEEHGPQLDSACIQ